MWIFSPSCLSFWKRKVPCVGSRTCSVFSVSRWSGWEFHFVRFRNDLRRQKGYRRNGTAWGSGRLLHKKPVLLRLCPPGNEGYPSSQRGDTLSLVFQSYGCCSCFQFPVLLSDGDGTAPRPNFGRGGADHTVGMAKKKGCRDGQAGKARQPYNPPRLFRKPGRALSRRRGLCGSQKFFSIRDRRNSSRHKT